MDIKICTNFTEKFKCELCNTSCSRQSEWERHILTRKHQLNVEPQQVSPEKAREHICSQCDKRYESRSGLWRHQKKCMLDDDSENIVIQTSPG